MKSQHMLSSEQYLYITSQTDIINPSEHVSEITTMKVKRETLNRLKKHGKMLDSYDKVVNRLLDEVEKNEI